MALNVPVASFKTTITSRVTSSATTIELDSVTHDEGSALSGTFGFVIDEGTADEEFVIGTVSGTSLTSCLRGVSVTDGITEIPALQHEHRKKATIKISSHPYLVRVIRALNGTDGFAAANVLKYAAAPTITPGSNQIPDVSYVDGVAIAGAANATTTTKGIVEIATQAEVTAGTATGGTGASLVSTPAITSHTVQDALWTYAADAQASDTYVIALTPAITAYAAGQTFSFKANTSNTTAATLNVNGLGAKNIKKYCNGAISDLETNDIKATQVVIVTYDGTQFLLQTPPATSLTSAAAYEAQQFFDNTSMTGAQATLLSTSSSTDASSTHKHLTKIGTDTFTPTSSADTKVITHNLGIVPNVIRIRYGSNNATGAGSQSYGYGTFDGTNYSTLYYQKDGNPAFSFGTSSTKIIYVDSQTSGTLGWDATITTLTTTQFTIDVSNYATSEAVVFTWEVQ